MFMLSGKSTVRPTFIPPGESISARELIETDSIVTYFQPILSARQRSLIGAEALSRGVVGVEALSRGSVGAMILPHSDFPTRLIQPSELFCMARDEGVSLELERACRATAVRTFASIPRTDDLILFLNLDAAALERDPAGLDDLLTSMSHAGLSPRNVAVEILESAFENTEKLRGLLSVLRTYGFLLVLDDVGAGHSNLDRIPTIRPDVLKLDRSLVVGIENDYHRQETMKSLVGLARRIGALVVAEGIETQEQAIVSLELGADLLQGFFLGRPQEPGQLSCPDAADRIDALARDYKSYMIRRINQRKLQHRRFNIILNEILCRLSNCAADQFDAVLGEVLPTYENVECIYVLDESGTQVTSTVCNPRGPVRNNGVMFRPARSVRIIPSRNITTCCSTWN
jgi:EAL domain-containing protein (putative c-di-GMP-specific phosphodiesterase class I)